VGTAVDAGDLRVPALSDAVASLAGYRLLPDLDAPATPERVLMAVEDIQRRMHTDAPAARPLAAK
jgi:xanthine dehydrogenase molybdopterin-binding subunit B